jgi:hypothetical protein
MTATYTPGGGERDYVRLLITDTDVTDPATSAIFADEEIDMVLSRESDLYYAAAQLLEIIATSEVLVQKRIRTLNLSTDGPAEATALYARAKTLRELSAESENDAPAFDVATLVVNNWSYRDQIWAAAQRRRTGI